MATRTDGFANMLNQRWKTPWLNSGHKFNRFYLAHNDALDAARKIEAQQAELAKSGQYTAQGVFAAIRTGVARESIPALKQVRERLDFIAHGAETKRARIALPKPDPDDMAAAMRRQEIRAYLRSLKKGEQAGLLLNEPDSETLMAAFEGPAYLSGVDSDLREKAEHTYLEKTFPDELADVEDQETVAGLVELALNHAVDTIRKEGGFESEAAFDEWMAEASGDKPASLQAA